MTSILESNLANRQVIYNDEQGFFIEGSATGWMTQSKQLTGVFLLGPNITDEVIAELHRLPALRGLLFARTTLTQSGIEQIAAIGTLEKVEIYQCREEPALDYDALKQAPNLTQLIVRN